MAHPSEQRLIGHFGATLPAWSVYLLGTMAVVLGLSIPVVVGWRGCLRGPAPETVQLPARELRPRLVRLPGAVFRMGSPESEPERDGDETLHWVRVSPFEICQWEVTQENWRAVMNTRPSNCEYGCGDALPVHDVSWFDAVDYLMALTALENRLRPKRPPMSQCYEKDGERVTRVSSCTGYRLPSEAEWEYAARAQTQTAYSFGDDPAALGAYAWFADNAGGKVHAVGPTENTESKRPNDWHLYDMHGNVWEWVDDWYGPYQRSERASPVVNPRGPEQVDAEVVEVAAVDEQGRLQRNAEGELQTVKGTAKLLRGGSFVNWAGDLRSADRFRFMPADRGPNDGFRCARDVPST